MVFWRFFQVGLVVTEFCACADYGLWEAMEDRLALLMEHGNRLAMPASECLGDGVFALRANCDNLQGRLIYVFGPQRRQIVFVDALGLKKTRRIPPAIITGAKSMKALIDSGAVLTHEFKIN
jgi:hypothetical protein